MRKRKILGLMMACILTFSQGEAYAFSIDESASLEESGDVLVLNNEEHGSDDFYNEESYEFEDDVASYEEITAAEDESEIEIEIEIPEEADAVEQPEDVAVPYEDFSVPEEEQSEAFIPEDNISNTEDTIERLNELMLAKADDTPLPGSFEQFNANARIFGLENDGNSLYSLMMDTNMIYQQLAEYAMEEKGLYYSSSFWISTFDSVFQTYPIYLYETILMDYLTYDSETAEVKSSLESRTLDYSLSSVSSLLGITADQADDYNKLVNDYNDLCFYEWGEIDALKKIDTDKLKFSKEVLDAIQEYRDDKEMLENAFEGFGDFINFLSKGASSDDKRKGMTNLLKAVGNNIADDVQMKSAFLDVANIYDMVDLEYFFRPTCKDALEMTGKGLDKLIETLEKAMPAEVQLVIGTIKLGGGAMDLLFASDVTSKELMNILTVYIIDSKLRTALRQLSVQYASDPTEENAKLFNEAFDAYLVFQMYGNHVAEQYIFDIINGGALTKTFAQIFYTENIETAEELAALCQSQTNTRKKIATFTKQYQDIYNAKAGLSTLVVVLNEAASKVPVTGISVKNTEVTWNVGDLWCTVGAEVLPENATDKALLYSSSDESIVTVDSNGNCTPVAPGTAVITVQTQDGKYNTTVNVTIDDHSGNENNKENEEFEYEIQNGYVVITGYNGNSTDIIIPEKIDGYPVKIIGDWAFYGCGNICSLDLPEGLMSIGSGAFSGCKRLSSLDLPEGLTSIGDQTFEGCKRLSSLDLPEGLTSIGDEAFYGCGNICSLDLPEGLTSIGDEAFYGCGNLCSLDLPEGLTSIGDFVFYGCESLSSLDLPEGLTSIGSGAFSGCKRLSSLDLPEGLTSIGDQTFEGCYSLSNLDLPEGLTSIGHGAFKHCNSLSSLVVCLNHIYT